ncbi:MAG: hypothetical protein QOF53_4142 [Nocardioidaceae bacterium]|nr:hypothetical protein [Nocardioidaceae bacterium]
MVRGPSWAARFGLRQHLRQSLWAVPLLGTVIGIGLAYLDLRLEGRIPLPPGWSYSASTASALLSAVAAAMVGLVGLVVTIGVLVVQMATGTLSPRFMRLWYRDRLQKVVLASFTATFAFAYILLSEVGSGGVPDLGVTVAGVAVTLDLFLLLLYLDRFVHALRPVAVAAAMARSGLAVVAATALAEGMPRATTPPRQRSGPQASLAVRCDRSGAIQAVNVRGIVDLAARRRLVCELRQTVGDFVVPGAVLADLWGAADESDARRVRGMVALGHERTIDQDPAFAVRIIVDIAIRALSPAINDPTTATQMINHIESLLFGIGSAQLHEHGVVRDREGVVRLTVPTRSWEDYLELAISEIRLYGATSPQVCRRLRAMLVDLEAMVPPGRRAAVAEQLALLDRTVSESFPDPELQHFALGEDRQGIGGASRPPRRADVGA